MNVAVWSALKGNKGGRTVTQLGSSPKWAIACFRAEIIVYFFPNTSRTILSLVCCTSAAESCHAAYNAWMGAGLTFAVAEIQPAPPWRIFASRNDSLPTNTSNPEDAKASSIAFVLFQS